jgi:hypothetical protein
MNYFFGLMNPGRPGVINIRAVDYHTRVFALLNRSGSHNFFVSQVDKNMTTMLKYQYINIYKKVKLSHQVYLILLPVKKPVFQHFVRRNCFYFDSDPISPVPL